MTDNYRNEKYVEPSRVVYVEGLAHLLATSPQAIRSHLQRRNFDAIPKPIRLGRRLAWTVEQVDAFLAEKVEEAESSPPPGC